MAEGVAPRKSLIIRVILSVTEWASKRQWSEKEKNECIIDGTGYYGKYGSFHIGRIIEMITTKFLFFLESYILGVKMRYNKLSLLHFHTLVFMILAIKLTRSLRSRSHMHRFRNTDSWCVCVCVCVWASPCIVDHQYH